MSAEPKKLALLRIWQILQRHSDYDHPMTQEEIIKYLENDYGIQMERKAVGKNIADLRDAGIDIGSCRAGSYIDSREFEDSELKLLIDGVLQSKHITARHSKDLIEKLCGLSNKYFRSHVKNVYSVNEWSKTENQALFYNIDVVDEAIASGKQVQYDYNKYGVDAKLSCFDDKSGQLIRLCKIRVIGISVVRKDLNINIGNADVKHTLTYAAVIDVAFSMILFVLWGIKADHGRVFRNPNCYQLSDCFA